MNSPLIKTNPQQAPMIRAVFLRRRQTSRRCGGREIPTPPHAEYDESRSGFALRQKSAFLPIKEIHMKTMRAAPFLLLVLSLSFGLAA
jgi:hypothetical protein